MSPMSSQRTPRKVSEMSHLYPDCIRCGLVRAADELGYCNRCHWAVAAEVVEGLQHLRIYLRKWTRFAEWCLEHEATCDS
jgi:hypothetical protein